MISLFRPTWLLIFLGVTIPTLADDFIAGAFTDSGGRSMPYQLLVPSGYDKTQQYPVVLFFHGAGGRGSDNLGQMGAGAWALGDASFQSRFHSFVIVPQCANDQQWVDMPWGAPSGVRPAQPSQSMQSALKILDNVSSKYNIDKNRIYVVGMSMGGYAVWDCITRYPERFAAGIVCCGGGDESTVTAAVAHVPVWVFHSVDDNVVPVARDRNMIAAMQKMGGHPLYIEYQLGIGHQVWGKAWEDPDLYPWLFGQKLNSRP